MNVEEVFGLEGGHVEIWPSLSITALPAANSTSHVALSPAEPKNDDFPSIPCFLPMQLHHTCNSASVMINLLPPPSSPKRHVQSIHKAWICHQCCSACGMILTHHANWCFFYFCTCSIDVISQQYLHLADVDKAQTHLHLWSDGKYRLQHIVQMFVMFFGSLVSRCV